MLRNANMLKILKKCVFADFMGSFTKMQSLVFPPERTFFLRENFVIHYIPSDYKAKNGR